MSGDSKPRTMDVIRAKSWRRTYSTHDGGVVVTQTERMTNGRVGVLLPLGSCFESEPFDLPAAFDAIARANGYVKNDEALAMVEELITCCEAVIQSTRAGRRDYTEINLAESAIQRTRDICNKTAGDGSGGGAPQRSRDAASPSGDGPSNPE